MSDSGRDAVSSFAFNPGGAFNARPAADGRQAGAQVSGGNSQGGAVTATQGTDVGPVAAGLGAYFGKLMEPYVARKQAERFSEGVTAAQSGIALSELSHPDNPITKIFGPTGFEQGAQFYTAQTAVSQYQQETLADADNLKQLSQPDLAKHFATQSQKALTGDPFADQIIQKGIMDVNGPLMNTIAKERMVWQQNNAVQAGQQAIASSGAGLQALVSRQLTFTQGTPDEDNANTATLSGAKTFMGLLAKPAGMTLESYQHLLTTSATNLMQAGNGFGVSLMKAGGMWDAIDAVARDKLDIVYEREGHKANNEMSGRVDFAQRLNIHDIRVQRNEFTPNQSRDDLTKINDDIKKATGFDADTFDPSAIRADGHTVTSAVIAADNKREERLYQQHLRNEDRAYNEQQELDKEARKVTLAKTLFTVGNVTTGMAGGAEKDLIDAQAVNAFQTGNVAALARVFSPAGGSYVAEPVKRAAQGMIDSSVGEQYNPTFEQAHKQWAAIYAAKPALALSIYGQYHPIMQKYDSLVKANIDPITAYSKTFGDAAQYGTTDINPDRRKEVEKNIGSAVSAQGTWNPFGLTDLGASGQNVVKQTVFRYVANAGNNSPQGTKALMDEAIEAASVSGEYERYGQFAVRNKAGTVPVGRMLGLQDRDASAVFTNVYNRHMGLVGAPTNQDPDSLIRYNDNGHPAFIAVVHNNKGVRVRAVIQYSELAKEAHDYVADKVADPGRNQDILASPQGGIIFSQ